MIISALRLAIPKVVADIKELRLRQEDVICLFPSDLIGRGCTAPIIIEVIGLFEKPERTDEVRQRLAKELGLAVKKLVPDAEPIECFISPFNPKQGFWSSKI
jgi:hypothetical protein